MQTSGPGRSLEERRHALDGFLRLGMLVCGVIAGWRAVYVLAVESLPAKAPDLHGLYSA